MDDNVAPKIKPPVLYERTRSDVEWETNDIQIYYQEDKDWFYRVEERRWITMNDNSSWRRIERRNGKVEKSLLHIA